MNYTTIWHEPRRRYGLSCNDYCVADIIHRLANNPANDSKWCYATRQTLGDMLGLSKVSILKIIDTLVGVGLVELHPETKQLRTTEAWSREFTDGKESLPIDSGKESLPPSVKKVYQSGKESLPPSVKKVYQSGKESLPYNNIYNNNENNTYNHHDTGGEVFEKFSSIPLKEKGETPPKAPPVPAAPPKPETLKEKVAEAAKFKEHPFSESEYSDREKFRLLVEGKYQGIDHEFYYMKVSGWLDGYGRPPKRKVWASVINQFLLNDYKNQKLQFKNSSNGDQSRSPSRPVKKSNDEIILAALKQSIIENGDDPNDYIHPAVAKMWN